MENIILAISINLFLSVVFYKIGHDVSETKIKKSTIQFSTNGKPVCFVERKNQILEITIYDKKLTRIIND